MKARTLESCDSEVRRLWNLNKRYPTSSACSARLKRIDDVLELRFNLQRTKEVAMELVGDPQ